MCHFFIGWCYGANQEKQRWRKPSEAIERGLWELLSRIVVRFCSHQLSLLNEVKEHLGLLVHLCGSDHVSSWKNPGRPLKQRGNGYHTPSQFRVWHSTTRPLSWFRGSCLDYAVPMISLKKMLFCMRIRRCHVEAPAKLHAQPLCPECNSICKKKKQLKSCPVGKEAGEKKCLLDNVSDINTQVLIRAVPLSASTAAARAFMCCRPLTT